MLLFRFLFYYLFLTKLYIQTSFGIPSLGYQVLGYQGIQKQEKNRINQTNVHIKMIPAISLVIAQCYLMKQIYILIITIPSYKKKVHLLSRLIRLRSLAHPLIICVTTMSAPGASSLVEHYRNFSAPSLQLFNIKVSCEIRAPSHPAWRERASRNRFKVAFDST